MPAIPANRLAIWTALVGSIGIDPAKYAVYEVCALPYNLKDIHGTETTKQSNCTLYNNALGVGADTYIQNDYKVGLTFGEDDITLYVDGSKDSVEATFDYDD